jgi:pimeloyl-ACP methyl ester carboxylesterase
LIHGTGRDPDNYFRTATAAAFLGGALSNTVVIAPRFASNEGNACRDQLAPNEVSWPCAGDSWRSGGAAAANKDLTSFDFADEILRKLAAKKAFPNLKAIVISGHSAGGQFVARYAMANQIHEKLGVPVSYIVANPSSYAYLDETRPTEAAYSVNARAPGYVPAPAAAGEDAAPAATGTPAASGAPTANAASATPALFRPFREGRACTVYDHWPYGLNGRTGYAARLTDDQLRKQLASRPVTYLLGDIDILPLGGFDSSCAAMAQGPTRFARGQAFQKYMNEKFGAQHKAVIVSLCGHNGRCIFTSEAAMQLIFPK